MAHWYKFSASELGIVICKAERKVEISEALPFDVSFVGCVARDKIGPLRDDPHITVFNSVNNLKWAVSRMGLSAH